MDKIRVAGLATIPDRLNTLQRVLNSLHAQVDIIEVSLNGHLNIPDFANKYPNALFTKNTNEKGDANKFYNINKYPNAYYFSCDDDIEYPVNYTQIYIDKIRKHQCVISIHGSDIPEVKINSYYRERKMKAHCLRNGREVFVDMVGSGVSGFDTSMFQVNYDEFIYPNMADIFLSMQAKKRGIKMLCIEHTGDWIKGGMNEGRSTIYEMHSKNCKLQTDLVNGFNWRK